MIRSTRKNRKNDESPLPLVSGETPKGKGGGPNGVGGGRRRRRRLRAKLATWSVAAFLGPRLLGWRPLHCTMPRWGGCSFHPGAARSYLGRPLSIWSLYLSFLFGFVTTQLRITELTHATSGPRACECTSLACSKGACVLIICLPSCNDEMHNPSSGDIGAQDSGKQCRLD